MSEESDGDDVDSTTLMKEADILMKQNRKLKNELEANKSHVAISDLDNRVKSQKQAISQLQNEIKQCEEELKKTESILDEGNDGAVHKTVAQLKGEIGVLKSKQKELKEKNSDILKQICDVNSRNQKATAALRQAKKQNEKLSSHLNISEGESSGEKSSSSVPFSSLGLPSISSPSASSLHGGGGRVVAFSTKEQQVLELRRRLHSVVTTKDAEIKSLQKKLETIQERNALLKEELSREQHSKGEKEQQMKVLLMQISKLENPINLSAITSSSSACGSSISSSSSSSSSSSAYSSSSSSSSYILDDDQSILIKSANEKSGLDGQKLRVAKVSSVGSLPPVRVSSVYSPSSPSGGRGGVRLRPLSGSATDSHNSVLPPRFTPTSKTRGDLTTNTAAIRVGGDDTGSVGRGGELREEKKGLKMVIEEEIIETEEEREHVKKMKKKVK